jgi:hypothetical protein
MVIECSPNKSHLRCNSGWLVPSMRYSLSWAFNRAPPGSNSRSSQSVRGRPVRLEAASGSQDSSPGRSPIVFSRLAQARRPSDLLGGRLRNPSMEPGARLLELSNFCCFPGRAGAPWLLGASEATPSRPPRWTPSSSRRPSRTSDKSALCVDLRHKTRAVGFPLCKSAKSRTKRYLKTMLSLRRPDRLPYEKSHRY